MEPILLVPAACSLSELISVALIFLAGPSMTRWLSRDVRFHNLGGRTEEQARSGGALSGMTSGFLLGFGLPLDGRRASDRFLRPSFALAANTETVSAAFFSPCDLFRRTCSSFPADHVLH